MPNRKGQFFYIAAHILFWVFVCGVFCKFSFLRPMALHYYKEVLSALLVAGMVYTDYIILIPKLLLKRKYVQFWLLSILLLIVAVAGEMMLVDYDMHIRAVWIKNLTLYYITVFISLLLRNASFFLFFLVLRLYLANVFVLETVERTYTQGLNKLIVLSPEEKHQLVDFNDIAYFSSDDGRILVTLRNGTHRHRDGSLSELENIIPSDLWFRANRQTLVLRDSIVGYTPTALCVSVNGHNVLIPYYSTKQDKLLEALRTWNPDLFSPKESMEDATLDDDPLITDDCKRILDYLAAHPGASVPQVAKALYFSLRTAHRRMAELRQRGKVDYQEEGNPNSGYIVLPNSSRTGLAEH